MSENNIKSTDLSPNKQALLKIRELKQQLEAAQGISNEPIAIVSMACRFPRRASTPEEFWQCLIEQTDEVSDIPGDRWDLDAFHDDDPEVPGKMYAKRGVFLDNIDMMDPEFFGISPREATWVDPQQRLLMEVGWEAIESAGWVPEKIGDSTGVFVGWMHNDYQNEASDSFLNLNPYIATGAAGSFLCGRLAYYLGCHGPSVAVDTACSSSLVALHLAIASLQRRDCDRALVGGVNAICSPTTNILTCKLKALSPTGQSRAFDAAADGYLRGEGCGVISVRRLKDAENDGDPILGVIRGSAVGHNGSGSGLTVPNPKAQEMVIRSALQNAGVSPNDISYLEAHGTGTELGDPIELQAAAAALGADRSSEDPILVGSVKTNIGHLEAAAGMAGLIKVLLAMQKGSIPGQLNFENPNPHIPWEKIPFQVLTEQTQWPNSQRRIAGVSAFGMSGTNAHVVIESPNPVGPNETEPPTFDRPQIVTVSAKNEDALFDLADRYAKHIGNDSNTRLEDFSYTTSVSRSHFDHRAAIVAKNIDELTAGLKSIARGNQTDSAFARHSRRQPKVAWQFTGQGSQYFGMGRRLYETEHTFRQAIDECDEVMRNTRGQSLIRVLFGSSDQTDEELLNDTLWTQPAIFAIQMGLVRLLNQWGHSPDIVMGHSVGQYAAACCAGLMSWQDGLRLIGERGRLISELPAGGKMLAVFASQSQVEDVIAAHKELSLAAVNGTHIVVSGDEDSVTSVANVFKEKGIRTKALVTSHAFHSSRMDPALGPFETFANTIEFRQPTLPLVCNVTGEILAADRMLDGKYWAAHIRNAVRYSDSIDTLNDFGCEVLIELGPQAVLTRMAASNWNQSAESLISCLEKGADDELALQKAIGRIYVHGANVDFGAMLSESDGKRIALPTYPFQRRRFWGPDKPRAFHAEYHTAHPLLGSAIELAGIENEKRFEGFIEPDSPAWLPDHEVMNNVVVPGSAYVEMAIEAAERKPITDLVFEQPLQPHARTALQTVIRKENPGNGDHSSQSESIATFSRGRDAKSWVRHFHCKIDDRALSRPEKIDRNAIEDLCTEASGSDAFYEKMSAIGLNYGSAFRAIQDIKYSDSIVLSKLQAEGDVRGYNVAPTILDAALHSLAVGLLHGDDDSLFLPVGIGRVECFASTEGDVWCYGKWKDTEGKNRSADLLLFNEQGDVVLKIDDLRVQQVSLAAMRQMSGVGAERLAFQMSWRPFRIATSELNRKNWFVIQIDSSENKPLDAVADRLSQKMVADGHEVVRLQLQDAIEFRQVEDGVFQFDGKDASNWSKLFDELNGGESEWQLDGIAFLIGGHKKDAIANAESNCTAILNLIKQLIDSGQRRMHCGFQIITNDGVAIDLSDEKIVNPDQAQYWGLGRVIGAEQPEFRCRLIDVSSDEMESAESVELIAELCLNETGDNQFAVRSGQAYVPRLVQSKLKSEAWSARPEGCYLVTGGLGMLGRQIAKWLAEKGAQQLVLVSRRAPDETAQAFIQSIKELGCEVIVHSADMSQREDVEELFNRFDSQWHKLAGVVHAAGILDDGLIESQTWERFERVLAPKVQAARYLHQFTETLDLDLFVLYSSAASILGSPGQSNYATGNAFLDGLAWHRRQQGLPAVSINWGPWTEGMADDERIIKQLSLQGITPLQVNEAHDAMEKMLASDTIQSLAMDVDWRRMRTGPGGESPMILRELVGDRKKSKAGDSALVAKLKQMRANEQRELLLKTIQDSLQRILSTNDAPETDRPLIGMGLDSLMAVEFGTELQQMLGDEFAVGPTMLFDHPTIDAITDYVLELIAADASDSKNEEPSQHSEGVANASKQVIREDIAIVGMSCHFPGANNVDEFWNNLLNGVDSVGDIPNDRWDIDRFYSAEPQPGKMNSRQGGFIKDIADFDADFFNINHEEACWIDPQHRMLLENSYHALEHAGIPTQPLADNNVGVFMGIMGQDYAFLPTLDDGDVIEGFQGAGLSHSAGVGRISYMFGFEGPSVAIDTASSSSLVAVIQAVRSLQDGNCNLALAGGVNAILAPVNSLLMSKAGLMAPDGRCKSFSSDANGFGRGEGCVVVVLKRLSDALRDGDQVFAVIRGGAIVHNGTSSGITAPSGKAQARAIDQALKDAGLAPSQIQYLEAHGTGTEFGDPMELTAANSIYSKGRKPDQPLLVGSVKANISHLEAAGGASGLIKTVLSLHHGVIPPQIHCENPSRHIPWQRMPIKLVTETTPWPDVPERIAAVTALGLVGTNAHVILSSEVSTRSDEMADDRHSAVNLLTLSARNKNALHGLIASYCDYLNKHPDIDLSDLCYSSSVGRRHYEHRAAVRFSDRNDALDQLKKFLDAGFTEKAHTNCNGHAGNGSDSKFNANGNDVIEDSPISIGVVKSQPKIGWVFREQIESAREFLEQLYNEFPLVRDIVGEMDERLKTHITSAEQDRVCITEMLQSKDATNEDDQLLSYATQACLAKLWMAWGIEPDVALGFGIGQYAAAAAAGCLCFFDGLILVYEKQRQEHAETPDWEAFEKTADGFNFYPPNLALIDSLTGDMVPIHRALGGSYWRDHAVRQVSLDASMQTLAETDVDLLMDFGIAGKETNSVNERLFELDKPVVSMRGQDSVGEIYSNLGKLYCNGCHVNFDAVYNGQNRKRISLPVYPFQKQRYWITEISKHKTNENIEKLEAIER